MKKIYLTMVAGSLLALGLNGTAMASAVTGTAVLNNITITTDGNMGVVFSPSYPSATSASSLAALYDSSDVNYQLVAQGANSNTGLGTSSAAAAGSFGSASASDTVLGGLALSVNTPAPVPSLQFAYAGTTAAADIWKNFTLTGTTGHVTFTADYAIELNDAMGNVPSNLGLGDYGTAFAKLELYKVDNGVLDPNRIKFSDQGIQIDEFQYDYKVSTNDPDYGYGKLVVGFSFDGNQNVNQDQVYALRAAAGADVRDPHATPEPATMLLLGSGLAGLVGIRRKKD